MEQSDHEKALEEYRKAFREWLPLAIANINEKKEPVYRTEAHRLNSEAAMRYIAKTKEQPLDLNKCLEQLKRTSNPINWDEEAKRQARNARD